MLVGNGMKLTRRIIIFALLACGSFWLSKASTRALLMDPQTKNAAGPTVILTPQDGAPLKVISTWVESLKPQNFKLVVQVQNQSGKAIRAYAFNSQTATLKQQNGHTQFLNLTERSAFWQPTEIKTVEVADSHDEPIKTVRLTIDFIEFADGSTWGPDSGNSRDLLAGQREGAKLTRRQFRQLMQSKGEEALMLEIQKNDANQQADAAISRNHSPQWIEGFRYGAASARRRLGNAVASGNKERIKEELDRPFDTDEQEPK